MSLATDTPTEPPARSASAEVLRSLHFGRAILHFWRAAGELRIEKDTRGAGDETDVGDKTDVGDQMDVGEPDEAVQSDDDDNTTELSGVKEEADKTGAMTSKWAKFRHKVKEHGRILWRLTRLPAVIARMHRKAEQSMENAANAACIGPSTLYTITSVPASPTPAVPAAHTVAPRTGSTPTPTRMPTPDAPCWSPEAVVHVANLAAQAVRRNLEAKGEDLDEVTYLAGCTAGYVAGNIADNYGGRSEEEIVDLIRRAKALAYIPNIALLRNLPPAAEPDVPSPNPAPHNDPSLALGPLPRLVQDALKIGDLARAMINAPRPMGVHIVRAIIHNGGGSQVDKIDALSIFDQEPRLTNDEIDSFLKCVQKAVIWARMDTVSFPNDPTVAAQLQEARLAVAHTQLALEL